MACPFAALRGQVNARTRLWLDGIGLLRPSDGGLHEILCSNDRVNDPFYKLARPKQFRRLAALASVAVAQYDLGDTQLVPLSYGASATYRLTRSGDGARFLFRIHTPERPREEIRSEATWLEALHRDGFVVPQPLSTRSRETVVTVTAPGVPEPRNCTLLTWIEGRFTRKRPTVKLFRGIGSQIARLHSHASRFSLPPGFTRPRWDCLSLFDDPAWRMGWGRLTRGQSIVFHEVAKRFQAVSSELGLGREVFGLVHGDFTLDNVLVHRGNVRIIDFDDCGFGYFLYDIATLLDRIEWREEYRSFRAALLNGYREARVLATEHEALLDLFLLVRWVFLGVAFLAAPEHSPARAYSPRFLDIVVPKMSRYLRII